MARESKGEAAFRLQLTASKIAHETEYRFHPERRWKFDFAFPGKKFAVEIEGGHWSGGRHTRGSGFEADIEKYEAAMMLGWTVYRCTTGMVMSGRALSVTETMLEAL